MTWLGPRAARFGHVAEQAISLSVDDNAKKCRAMATPAIKCAFVAGIQHKIGHAAAFAMRFPRGLLAARHSEGASCALMKQ